MPIYEYQCQQCQHQFDALQKISDAPLVACPSCGKDGLQKLLSAPSFQLKGSGWYQTDYKKSSKPDPEKTTKKEKSSDAD